MGFARLAFLDASIKIRRFLEIRRLLLRSSPLPKPRLAADGSAWPTLPPLAPTSLLASPFHAAMTLSRLLELSLGAFLDLLYVHLDMVSDGLGDDIAVGGLDEDAGFPSEAEFIFELNLDVLRPRFLLNVMLHVDYFVEMGDELNLFLVLNTSLIRYKGVFNREVAHAPIGNELGGI